jgi:hypothetical protein
VIDVPVRAKSLRRLSHGVSQFTKLDYSVARAEAAAPTLRLHTSLGSTPSSSSAPRRSLRAQPSVGRGVETRDVPFFPDNPRRGRYRPRTREPSGSPLRTVSDE